MANLLRSGWIWLILLVGFVLFLGGDVVGAQARLDDVHMDVRLDPPDVVADGKSQIVLFVRVTEGDKPREGDLLQSWIVVGGGIIRPEWTYTDANGEAAITFSPNSLTRYDVQDHATIQLINISIGNILEVRKEIEVEIPLRAPDQPAEPRSNILG